MLPKRVIIVPYNMFSNSAKALTQALRDALNIPILKVSTASTKYQPRWTDYVINWGCSKEWPWINTTEKNGNQRCVNKLTFFQVIDAHNQVFKDKFINLPKWTTDPEIVRNWINQGKLVLMRLKLTGHSGDGIFFVDPPYDTISYAPLYVQYKKKKNEYRVHFFKVGQGKYEIIDITQKKMRKGFENVDTKIRNHKNGWVYAREDIIEPQDLRTQALNAAFASDLDFGAVDLIWNEHENKCYVLEVNTAPGLTGTTLSAYINAFVKDITK